MGRAGWERGGSGKGKRMEDEQVYEREEKGRRCQNERREFGSKIGEGVGRVLIDAYDKWID
jgi:hypothetical protein